jgi:hypothetical protein
MKKMDKTLLRICLLLSVASALISLLLVDARGEELWPLAQKQSGIHRFSTLFLAQDIRDLLSTAEGIEKALLWCKNTGVTKVYIEEFRDGYQAKREAILRVKERFLAEGFAVAGCITATKVGKPSTTETKQFICALAGALLFPPFADSNFSGVREEPSFPSLQFNDILFRICQIEKGEQANPLDGKGNDFSQLHATVL